MRQPSCIRLLRRATLPPKQACSRLLRALAWTALLALIFVEGAVGQGTATAALLPPFRIDPGLQPDIVLNADQGLGQCHWLDPNILSVPYVAWAYDAGQTASGWATLEPQGGVFNWAPLDAEVAKARRLGKHIWLELLTTEGQTPQWAKDAGVVVIGSRGGTPVPWNEAYQRVLRRAVHAMAARYDNDPTVDAINLMAGGCYGEMAICAPQTDGRAWEQAGYTDGKFAEAVKQTIDIYLEQEHVWEDGSRTHGFLKTPIVLQLGAGLYGHTTTVIQPVVDYAIPRYGMRVWLKYNGLGGGYDMGWVYEKYSLQTRVGYEPAGNSPDFLNRPKDYIAMALDQHSSYLCLQSPYFNIENQQWREARESAARYLGAQIICQGADAPEQTVPGGQFTLVTNWVNRGTVPLMRPERQGEKDVPASYDILVAFVNEGGGVPAFEFTFAPPVPTTNWYSAQPIRIEQVLSIPSLMPAGEYDLRVALVNPNLPVDDQQRYYHLVNSSLHDGQGRYTLRRIRVLSATTPTTTATSAPEPSPTYAPTPTPTPGPEPTGNWLSRWLRNIWEWVRYLLRAFE